MRLVVAVVGKARNPALSEAIRDYEKRAARYWPLDVHEAVAGAVDVAPRDRAARPGGADLSSGDDRARRAVPQMSAVSDDPVLMHAAGPQEADWFEEWFGEDYLHIYQHRDETEAERAIELIATNLAGRRIDTVLDLACGAGRHTRVLRERWWTVGLDLSMSLLKLARKESDDAPYVRADMRELPFGDSSFDLVVNLFTSFGYFDDDSEHVRVLNCV